MLTKHWEPYFTFSSLQSVMILSIFSILLNGCGTPSATFGSVKIQGLSSWQETDLNVEEEGRYFKFPMTLTALKDQSVPIRVFSDSNELLGESFVIPSYDSTDWKEFSVFIPLSSLRKIGKENAGFKIYAVSPKNPAAFVASEHYTVSHLDQEPITWQLKGVEADVEVGGGIKGIKIKFELTVFDKMGERLELIPFVNGYSIPDDEQNKYASIRFEEGVIKPGYENARYSNLVLIVPYEGLERFVSGSDLDMILISPGTRFNGSNNIGNIRLKLPPAGTVDRQIEIVNRKLRSIDDSIKYLEKESDILSRDQ